MESWNVVNIDFRNVRLLRTGTRRAGIRRDGDVRGASAIRLKTAGDCPDGSSRVRTNGDGQGPGNEPA